MTERPNDDPPDLRGDRFTSVWVLLFIFAHALTVCVILGGFQFLWSCVQFGSGDEPTRYNATCLDLVRAEQRNIVLEMLKVFVPGFGILIVMSL